MTIWKKPVEKGSVENRYLVGAHKHMHLTYIDSGEDFLSMGMEVTEKNLNPYGTIHGGCLAFLAESTANMAADSAVDENHYAVAINMNINHLKPSNMGFLIATAHPVKIGRTLQVWKVNITDENKAKITDATLMLYTQEVKT
jgi:1,4-dihydroxy-2-naphthoyl-CoA hydrolase